MDKEKIVYVVMKKVDGLFQNQGVFDDEVEAHKYCVKNRIKQPAIEVFILGQPEDEIRRVDTYEVKIDGYGNEISVKASQNCLRCGTTLFIKRWGSPIDGPVKEIAAYSHTSLDMARNIAKAALDMCLNP